MWKIKLNFINCLKLCVGYFEYFFHIKFHLGNFIIELFNAAFCLLRFQLPLCCPKLLCVHPMFGWNQLNWLFENHLAEIALSFHKTCCHQHINRLNRALNEINSYSQGILNFEIFLFSLSFAPCLLDLRCRSFSWSVFCIAFCFVK